MTNPPPVDPQPAVPQPAAPQPVANPGDYPGKTLGIVGLVLVFFTVVIGLILSHIALAQSKKAGYSNTPAKVGVILGWIFVGIGLLWLILFFALILPLSFAASVG